MSASGAKGCDQLIGWLMSAVVHMAVVLLLLACGGMPQVESPLEADALVTPMLDVSPPSPVPEEPAPAPEPEPIPEPEPPKPEPIPEPEPPKPEPIPEPEPPKPEPIPVPTPKPVPEPPKPEPKPVPTPVPEPKPVPKPATPKPKTLAERLKDAKIVKAQPEPPRKKRAPSATYKPRSSDDLKTRLAVNDVRKVVRDGSSTGSKMGSKMGSTQRQQSVNYAAQVVRPYLYELWNTPAVGDSRPTPVVIEMDVSADGRVRNARITQRSSDSRMNDSVQQLLGRIGVLASFKSVGVTYQSLHIVVTMQIDG